MHGLGNDFAMLDLISQPRRIDDALIKKLSDRHLGIGFDQLLTIQPPNNPDVDFRYVTFNADGSEAEQCGNGARCVTRFVRDEGLTVKSSITLETSNRVIACRLENNGEVTVNMGPPELRPEAIPFIADQTRIQYELAAACDTAKTVHIAAVNVGNPHAVLTVQSVETAPVRELGSLIEQHARFPEGVNVGFMEVTTRNKIRLRVFERGTGETQACGTGACAAVVAGRLQGLLDELVEVTLPGGQLRVNWAGDDAPVMMTGPAYRVYEGKVQV